MKLGVCVASHIGDLDYVVRAEELGYVAAWFADSQMLWSDCYATLALAATRTRTIRIGTGVAVSGTRPSSVTAASIATINALAPGRTFLGVGSGNTAMRIMGSPPQRIADFERFLREIRPLLRGEEASVERAGKARPIRHLMPDRGFVNFTDPIPMHVSGFGARSLGLAGAHGDGAVVPMPRSASAVGHFWEAIESGARAVGRKLDRNRFPICALGMISVLDPGESVDSPRIREECGPFAMAGVHFAYDQWRQLGKPPPAYLSEFWGDYCAMLDEVPEDRRHLRIHTEHNCWVAPEEERFVTAASIEATCLVGTADEIVQRLAEFEAAGLDQVMILPAFDPRYDVLERVGRDIIPRV
jgi:5,10-methylenetetrahydromethanopterin reductase